MFGMDEFIEVFGNINLAFIIQIIIALAFCIIIYKKVKKYLVEQNKAAEEKDKQLTEALECVKVCANLKEEIQTLKVSQDESTKRLQKIEEESNTRNRNRIRDSLLQNYRYYTSGSRNPSMAWTRMESEVFWEQFRDYERLGGNGYMHTVVQPEMNSLTIVEMNDTTGIADLMKRRYDIM